MCRAIALSRENGFDWAVVSHARTRCIRARTSLDAELPPRFTASLRPYTTPVAKSPIRIGAAAHTPHSLSRSQTVGRRDGAVTSSSRPHNSSGSGDDAAVAPVDFLTTAQAQEMLQEGSELSATAASQQDHPVGQ